MRADRKRSSQKGRAESLARSDPRIRRGLVHLAADGTDSGLGEREASQALHGIVLISASSKI
jgi:hypothetical protein